MLGTDSAGNAIANLAILFQVLALAFILCFSHLLSKWKVSWLGDASVALIIGAVVGFVLHLAGSTALSPFLHFNQEFFFVVLLPPIIFQAGYSLDTQTFVGNIGAISTFAFAGTAISTAVIGLVLWSAGQLGACLPVSLLESLLFGAIVSATDPVTVLAVFEKLHADSNLYALVFGESVLNDAVAIVLYKVLSTFLHTPVTTAAVSHAVGSFLLIFVGSLAIGMGIGFLFSFMVRSRLFRSEQIPLESCLVVLLAYSSYLLADTLHLSGIVSILFTGMIMSHYTKPNLSRIARRRIGGFFKISSTLAETFVFFYIGTSLITNDPDRVYSMVLPFMAVSLLALAVSRAAHVWPLSLLINLVRGGDSRIPQSQQFMLWWSGLRGAMAFALAIQASRDLPGGTGEVMLITVYLLIFVTVLINGGGCSFLLAKLGLQQPPEAHGAPPVPGEYEQLRSNEDDLEEKLIAELEGRDCLSELLVVQRPGRNDVQGGVEGDGSSNGVATGGLGDGSRRGLLRHLSTLDERYLSRFFLPHGRGTAMSEAPAGDMDSDFGSW